MKYIPEIEFSSPTEIYRHQSEKLNALIRYVSQRSPYYISLFARHHIQPDSIQTPNDLIQLPTTTKNDLQQANWEFLCIERNKIVEYTSTSGTLGKPVTLALSLSDIQRLAYNEAISFACADGGPDDIYQLMLTLDRQFMAGVAYYEGIRKLGAGMIRVGPGLPAMQWDSILRLKPTALVGVPSFMVKLLDYAVEHNIDVNTTAVKKIICIGENIREPDLSPNSLAKRITGSWNVTLFGTYASTEMQTAFTECNHGGGGHHHPELLIVEILDDDGNPVSQEKPGEVTITTLGVEAMPLIRYRTGDVARTFSGQCMCGRTTLRLGPVLGRKQQMLKLKGTTVYPPAIFEVLNGQKGVQDYVVEAVTGSLGTDELKIHVLADAGHHDSVYAQLKARFQSTLRVIPKVIFTDQRSLQKLNESGNSRKVRRFVDSRS
jgi:phenylacetate-CoA ligase